MERKKAMNMRPIKSAMLFTLIAATSLSWSEEIAEMTRFGVMCGDAQRVTFHTDFKDSKVSVYTKSQAGAVNQLWRSDLAVAQIRELESNDLVITQVSITAKDVKDRAHGYNLAKISFASTRSAGSEKQGVWPTAKIDFYGATLDSKGFLQAASSDSSTRQNCHITSWSVR